MTPLEKLLRRAHLLGGDSRVTPPELGSVAAKLGEIDPFTAQPVEVLWVSGEGADLRHLAAENLSSLYLDSVLSMETLYLQAPETERGPRSAIDRRLAGMYGHCAFNLNLVAPSADVALHAFLPGRHTALTYPETVMALAVTRNPDAAARQVFGDEVAYVPWQRSGVELALKIRDLCAARPAVRGIILGTHGFATWADDARACDESTRRLVDRAAILLAEKVKAAAELGGVRYAELGEPARRSALIALLPWLRGRLGESSGRRQVAHVDSSEAALRWVNSQDGVRLSTAGASSLPHHFRRAKLKPLHVEWDPHKGEGIEGLRDKLTLGLARYRREYIAYYRKHKLEDTAPIRDPNPTVVLIPGLGLIAWAPTKAEAQVLTEWTLRAMAVARGAEALDKYQPLALPDVFAVEYAFPAYTPPPEAELARRVILVIGAGGGIGRDLAGRLHREGAQVICADLDANAARAEAEPLKGLGLGADVANRASVRALLDETILAFGGLDGVAITAGLWVAPDAGGHISDERWRQTYDVNVMGCYLVADEAARIWRDQGLSAALVLTTSANAVTPRGGSLAFEASKAAANQLVRELAVELAPLVRVNGVAPASVVQGSGMFPRERVIASLAQHDIAHRESETDEALREKLARFYAERTLIKLPVLPTDAAEALYLLLGERLSKTTGQIVTVDGGSQAAFLR